jgi:formamidopyrimidine-DNA glycosylase
MVENPGTEFCGYVIQNRIESVARRGKMIIINLSGGHSLLIHLGMTGRLLILPASADVEKHTHVLFELGPDEQLRYVDVRRFGMVRSMETGLVEPFLQSKKLGPEPMTIEATEFRDLLSTRRAAIKGLLLSQSLVAGIGNIYADEILHRAGIHPLREASDLSSSEGKALHRAMVEVLNEAIEKKGSTVSDYVDARGKSGSFQNHHQVYRRTGLPCFTCGSQIRRKVVAGRSTHYCTVCQPLKKVSKP